MNTNKKHFGKALGKYLLKKGITKAWLAREMGIYQKSIYDALKVEQPRQDTLIKYLNVLNITEEELYDISSNVQMVTEESTTYQHTEPKKTIEIPVSDFEYFMSALKELDMFRARELEKQQQEITTLQEANRVDPQFIKQ